MNTTNLKALGFAMTLTLAAPAAVAGVTEGAGKWAGAGASFDRNGQETSQFQIEMVSTALDEHTLRSEGTLILSDGSVRTFWQSLRDTDSGFAMDSDQGQGGGYCFGEGLCQAYIGTQARGIAVTVIHDADGSMRFSVTGLEAGKAVYFVREKLRRKE